MVMAGKKKPQKKGSWDDLLADIEALKAELSAVKQKNIHLTEKVTDLTGLVNSKDSEIQRLLEQLQSLKEIKDYLQSEFDKSQDEIARLGQDIANLELEKLSLVETLSKNDAERDEMTLALSALKDELSEVQTQLGDFESVLELSGNDDNSLPRLQEIFKFVSDLVGDKKKRDAKTFANRLCQTEEGGIDSFGGEVGFEHESYSFQYEDGKVLIAMKVFLLMPI